MGPRLYSAWVANWRGCFSWETVFTSRGFIGILFGIFSKNNIPNVFGRIVPKPMDSAMRKMAGKGSLEREGLIGVVIGVTEP